MRRCTRASATPTLARGVVIGAGAKVLGPFVVGENARIGSNAVVVGEVPAGATAIGIPARVVTESTAQRREQNAARTGFSACAVTGNADDPLSIALHGLIDHMAGLSAKVEAMAKGARRDRPLSRGGAARRPLRRTPAERDGRLTSSGQLAGSSTIRPPRNASPPPRGVAVSASQSGRTQRSRGASSTRWM